MSNPGHHGPGRSRRPGLSAAVVIAAVGCLWGTAPAAEAAAPACTWKTVPAAGPGTLAAVVAVPGTHQAWAVGDRVMLVGGRHVGRTLIERWNGTSWSIVAGPNIGTGYNQLTAVAASGPSDVWAVGYYANSSGYHTLAERWNGSTWQVVPSPNLGGGSNFLEGLTAVPGSAQAWAVGYALTGQGNYRPIVERSNGASWSLVQSPSVPGATLASVSAAGPTNIWSVGDVQSSTQTLHPGDSTLVEHWNGGSWTEVSSPNVGSGANFLNSVAPLSGGRFMAVGGEVQNGARERTLTELSSGASWAVRPSPNVGRSANDLHSISQIPGSAQLWSVGAYENPAGAARTLVLYFDGSRWGAVPSPDPVRGDNFLFSVAASTTEAWAVGYGSTAAGESPLALHCAP